MEVRGLLAMALNEYLRQLRHALAGLSREERRYQPTPDANHIDFLVWHMARGEDDLVQWFAKGVDTVWQTGRWPERLGLPEQGDGFGYDADQVKALPTFDIDEMMRYFDSVRQGTMDFIAGLTPAYLDLSLPRTSPNSPRTSLGSELSHLIVEESRHLGQVEYIRGLHRGLGK